MINMRRSSSHFTISDFIVSLWVVLIVVVAVVVIVDGQQNSQINHNDLCNLQGCNCTVTAGSWKNIQCNLVNDQILTLEPGHIPIEVTEVNLHGGKSLIVTSKTFNGYKAFTLLHVANVDTVVFHSGAFNNIQSSSLHLHIVNCNHVSFKSHSFEELQVQGSLTIEIQNVTVVNLEEAPFSKLSNGTFQNINQLTLESRSFEIPNLDNIGRHGPSTVVSFINVSIPDIPEQAFLTSLAEIVFQDSHIGNILTKAIRSAQISSIQMINTNIDTMKWKSFDDPLIVDFRIDKCIIDTLDSESITAGMTNFTINHSTITNIRPKAVVSTAAKVEIIGNQIVTLSHSALIINKWNRITMNQNVIKNLYNEFIIAEVFNTEVEYFSFKGNEIYNLMGNSLNFVSKINDPTKLVIDDNFFNQTCSCDLLEWIESLSNTTQYNDIILQTSFCKVDRRLSECFSLPIDIINMENFTEKACQNNTICEPYNGESRTINTTDKIFIDHESTEAKTWLIIIIAIIVTIIVAVFAVSVVLLVRGSRWLKRNGYFRKNYYGPNNHSNEDEENTIVTIDMDQEKLEIPDELTIEFLRELSRRLDEPSTEQEATEMIERLYEIFIVDDSYENNNNSNNRDEDAHLYEELGNLNRQIPPPPYEEQESPSVDVAGGEGGGAVGISTSTPQLLAQSSDARDILKIMEEKFSNLGEINNYFDLDKTKDGGRTANDALPILTGHYSEPIDKDDMHLYSELKQKDENRMKNISGTTSSNNIALRPLPDRPEGKFRPGPSSQF